jgi:hypothetical protein
LIEIKSGVNEGPQRERRGALVDSRAARPAIISFETTPSLKTLARLRSLRVDRDQQAERIFSCSFTALRAHSGKSPLQIRDMLPKNINAVETAYRRILAWTARRLSLTFIVAL